MQLTLRISPELADELKHAAALRGQSVNAFAGAVLSAAVDPDLAGDEPERIRARLARAGLLSTGGSGDDRDPIDPAALRAARAEAGRRTALSELVREGRR